MRTVNAFYSSLLVVGLLGAMAPSASAQVPTSDPPAPPAPVLLGDALHGSAKDAYDAAKLLVLNGDFQGALAKFQQAYELSKDPRLLSNMGVCEKNLHHYARMKMLFEQYEREAGASMTPEEHTTVSSALAAIAGLVGTLKLTISPDAATVVLDGVAIGTSPLRDALFLDLGKHTVTARLAGFEPVERPIYIAGGTGTELEFTLKPVEHIATLTVAVEDAATVTVDGKAAGLGRYRNKIGAGPHTVRVTEVGKLPFESEIELRDGETRTLDVTLREEKHGAAVWPWVVSGLALAAGAAVGGYFLLQPSNTTTPVPTGTLGVGSVQLTRARLFR
jgi:PEGA domain